jgi:hypothetical protein
MLDCIEITCFDWGDTLNVLLCHAAADALRTAIGSRSGLIGLVIQLARDLQLACEENSDLLASLHEHCAWQSLTSVGGPLSQLLAEQQGSLAGGMPNTTSLQGMYDNDSPGGQIYLRALFGVREYSQMHQSLNLAIPLQH